MLGLFRKSKVHAVADLLYRKLVRQARDPVFYLHLGVPDTPDGRFDLIILQAFLVIRRLKADHERPVGLAQAIFDLMFADMDQNLREMGVGDLGVSKRIKGMAEAFYGRTAAYEEGLMDNGTLLGRALQRNLYRTTAPARSHIEWMIGYMRHQSTALTKVPIDSILKGEIKFAHMPITFDGTCNES